MFSSAKEPFEALQILLGGLEEADYCRQAEEKEASSVKKEEAKLAKDIEDFQILC